MVRSLFIAVSLLFASTAHAAEGASAGVKVNIELRCTSTPAQCEAALAALTGQRPSREMVSQALVPGGVMLDDGVHCRVDAVLRVCDGV